MNVRILPIPNQNATHRRDVTLVRLTNWNAILIYS